MDNLAFGKIKEAIDKYNVFAIATPKDPSVDEMGAALSLYLALKGTGKSVSISTPNTPLVEVSSLVGIDEVKNVVGTESGDLVLYLPYKEGEIDKVSSIVENNQLKLIVKAGEKGLSFTERDVQFQRGSTAPETLFIVGASRVSDLGKLFDPALLKDTLVINIDNAPDNQGFGDIVVVSTRFSSVSEAVANLLYSLGLKTDLDIAQNLMLGIATATNNFQDSKTSSLAFEMAGALMRQGALRPTSSSQRRKLSNDFESTIKTEEKPLAPQTPLADKQTEVTDNPPEDWLEPKIYKGSTNF